MIGNPIPSAGARLVRRADFAAARAGGDRIVYTSMLVVWAVGAASAVYFAHRAHGTVPALVLCLVAAVSIGCAFEGMWGLAVLAWHPDAHAWRQARSAYFQVQDRSYRLYGRLGTLSDPYERTSALNDLADGEAELARLHPVAFGPDPNPDEDDRDLAESLASSAALLYALTETERCAALGDSPRQPARADLEATAGPVLDEMATTGDGPRRWAMLPALYEAVAPVVGGQAAETVATLPYPGAPFGSTRALLDRPVPYLPAPTASRDTP